MGNDIFVWVEQFDGQPAGASFEAIGAARRLADELGGGVTACLFGGEGLDAMAQEAIAHGADKVLVAAGLIAFVGHEDTMSRGLIK